MIPSYEINETQNGIRKKKNVGENKIETKLKRVPTTFIPQLKFPDFSLIFFKLCKIPWQLQVSQIASPLWIWSFSMQSLGMLKHLLKIVPQLLIYICWNHGRIIKWTKHIRWRRVTVAVMHDRKNDVTFWLLMVGDWLIEYRIRLNWILSF